MITIFTMILLVLVFKATVGVIKVCGKLIGGIIGFMGSLIVAAFVLAGIGMAITFVPLLVVGLLIVTAFGIIARVAK